MALLCHCHVVSEQRIVDAVGCGASTLEAVEAHCGAGGQCGGCVSAIEAILDRCVAVLDGAAA